MGASFIDLKHALNSIDLQEAAIHICSMQSRDVRQSYNYFELKYSEATAQRTL